MSSSMTKAAPPAAASDNEGYSKGLKNRHIQMIGIGGAIGSGLFVGSASRLHQAGPSLIISYAICGIVAMIVVRALGEMVLHRPTPGAFVSYSREFLGEGAGFAAGWFHFLNWAFTIIADCTAIAVFLSFWPGIRDSVPQWGLAAIALAVVLAVNLIGVKLFGEMEFWFSAIKVAAIIIFMLIAIFFIVTQADLSGNGQQATAGFHNITDSGFFPNGVSPMFQLMSGIIFAFAAMELIGVAAGEAENPREIMPKAVRSVLWRILVFYIGTIGLLAILLPTSQYTAGESPFVTVLDRVGFHLGPVHMADIMNVVLISAVASSMNSGLYSTGRVLRTMSLAGAAPKYLAKMSSHHVPYAAILTTAFFGLLGVGINYMWPSEAFEIVLEIATIGIIGVWSLILLAHMGMLRKVKRGEMVRPDFRLRGAPVLNVFALVFLLTVLVLIGIGSDPHSALAVRIGLPVVAVLMVGGWMLVRNRVNGEALDREGMV
ncbi:amino acid permease [Falsarthrobacter nasiphocae]|uniref:L-asparagine permease n=1 Tax=Falsarthrobacter nasiphocae TaxID=189863 RepID=A0AAE3YG34_9MICC|nr:amino acid permease [Falsarthrobacter nasiphocae]MDR6891530.1 L-asparagine permease [Falsarthrobacter nasiphocae]